MSGYFKVRESDFGNQFYDGPLLPIATRTEGVN